MTRNLVSSLLLAGFVILSGCAAEPPPVVEVAAEDTVTPLPEPIVVEEVRVPPDWTQAPSPSPAEVCKVPDARQGAGGNSQARQAVGFPVSKSTLPIQGEVNIIAAMVAFDDAPAPDLTADEFFEPQLEKITRWSDFWSLRLHD